MDQHRNTTPHLSTFMNRLSAVPGRFHPYRGYVINMGPDDVLSDVEKHERAPTEKKPIWFVCSGWFFASETIIRRIC